MLSRKPVKSGATVPQKMEATPKKEQVKTKNGRPCQSQENKCTTEHQKRNNIRAKKKKCTAEASQRVSVCAMGSKTKRKEQTVERQR